MLATFITISEENVTQMFGYVGDLLTDLTPFLSPIFKVAIGIFIFWAFTKVVKP